MNEPSFLKASRAQRTLSFQRERLRAGAFALLVLFVGFGSLGCAGVRPEQRAILADPTMVPRSDPLEAEAREHVFDNREGAFGGGSVQGGGCGCN